MQKELTAKPIIKEIFNTLEKTVEKMTKKPHLVLMTIGDDPASAFYVRNIIKRAEKLSIRVSLNRYPNNISQQELLNHINTANDDSNVSAIMIQKPLPSTIDETLIASSITPFKDVDGFTPNNLGNILIENESLAPCTPVAVMKLIDYYGIELQGKHTVLCGRSLTVGKPLLNMLIKKDTPGNATVTVCHSRTNNLHYYTSQADILITALGIARFIKKEMIKENAIIIDVGTNEIVEEGKTTYVGDVDYNDCYDKVSAITPVPGGVGSITTAVLMQNIVKAALMNNITKDG